MPRPLSSKDLDNPPKPRPFFTRIRDAKTRGESKKEILEVLRENGNYQSQHTKWDWENDFSDNLEKT